MAAITADVSRLATATAGSLLARDLWLFALAPSVALAAAADAAQVRAVSGWTLAALTSSETALPPAAFLLCTVWLPVTWTTYLESMCIVWLPPAHRPPAPHRLPHRPPPFNNLYRYSNTNATSDIFQVRVHVISASSAFRYLRMTHLRCLNSAISQIITTGTLCCLSSSCPSS